jgi:hypothetical protein
MGTRCGRAQPDTPTNISAVGKVQLPDEATMSAAGANAPADDPVKPSETPSTPPSGARKAPRPYLEIDASPTEFHMSPRDLERKISFDPSPLSCKSTGSSAEFFQADQTILIFDWDDTLCPTTTCMRTYGLSVLGDRPTGELAESLELLAREVNSLLERALELAGLVVIVTNAEEGWVELAQKAWLPGIEANLSRCQVASARSSWEPHGVTSPAGWKARTFEDFIERFYSRYPSQSWKNIISIGDAPHEREALSRVVRWAPYSGGKKCRSKSVKFVIRPSVEQIILEIQMLMKSMGEIVAYDDDLDLHFSREDLKSEIMPGAG